MYLIKSLTNPEKIYIGHTNNLKERLATHNSGGSLYTKADRPLAAHSLKIDFGNLITFVIL